QAGIGTIIAGGYGNSSESGELDHGEDVMFGLSVADDEIADCLWGVGLLQFGDGAEGLEKFGGRRGEFWRKLSCFCRELGCGGHFHERLRLHAGVLANVERVQVEAEGSQLE